MNAGAIYNEIEPFAADWLERLAEQGHIAPGRVERRSITDLTPADVAGPGQRHFFAGIGGWSYALRLAGVPDDASVWTGSCPCQPFSDAGKGLGVRDPRHLWPTWFELVEQCRPPVLFGEQVASRAGLAWLDLVRADLERCGYAFGASDLCAAGVGAPHIRQRLYFVAYARGERREGQRLRVQPGESRAPGIEIGGAAKLCQQLGSSGSSRSGWIGGGLSDAETQGEREGRADGRERDESGDAGATRGMAVSDGRGRRARGEPGVGQAMGDGNNTDIPAATTDPGVSASRQYGCVADGDSARRSGSETRKERGGIDDARRDGADCDPWRSCEWLPCTDGVSRPVEPSAFPLAHGVPARVGRLRGYGNAIVPQVAAAFIKAAFDAIEEG